MKTERTGCGIRISQLSAFPKKENTSFDSPMYNVAKP